MALLLSRTAERLYWAARYLERAEDTSRMVLAFGELFEDVYKRQLDQLPA